MARRLRRILLYSTYTPYLLARILDQRSTAVGPSRRKVKLLLVLVPVLDLVDLGPSTGIRILVISYML